MKEYFDAIIRLSEEFLSGFGFKRSGKSNSFYKINGDKTEGYMILFRRSLLNTPDNTGFGINHIRLRSKNVRDRTDPYGTPKITVSLLKKQSELNGLSYNTFTIGELTLCEPAETWFQKNVKPELIRILSAFSAE